MRELTKFLAGIQILLETRQSKQSCKINEQNKNHKSSWKIVETKKKYEIQ